MTAARENIPPLGDSLDLIRRIWSVAHGLEVLSARMSKTLGITAQQRMILRIAGRFPGITAGRLSELLCVDAATVSSALARLQRRGLVSRERDRRDRRRVSVALTERGRELDAPAAGTVEAAVDDVLAQATGEDVRAAHRVLAALAVSLLRQARPEETPSQTDPLP
jgi:MarR family transcriptional regulator, organic hydroperoxide resistance regulator